jgi:hypothetical protein
MTTVADSLEPQAAWHGRKTCMRAAGSRPRRRSKLDISASGEACRGSCRAVTLGPPCRQRQVGKLHNGTALGGEVYA